MQKGDVAGQLSSCMVRAKPDLYTELATELCRRRDENNSIRTQLSVIKALPVLFEKINAMGALDNRCVNRVVNGASVGAALGASIGKSVHPPLRFGMSPLIWQLAHVASW